MLKKLSLLAAVATVLLGTLISHPVHADTNDFDVHSFTADYYISQDEDGRSRMRVKEEIVVEFPSFDQNHGIERAIPESYDGHTVSLKIKGVKKANSTTWNYSTYGSGGNLVLRIGDADRYVHGKQTYIIEYELRDVTKAFPENDELFWDVNGTEWSQSFGTVTARVHVPKALAARLTGQKECFTGVSTSTSQACSEQATTTESETIYTFGASSLGPRENLSFVIGFTPSSFQPFEQSPLALVLVAVVIVLGLLWYVAVPMIVLVRSLLYWRRHGRDPRGRGTIIAEYVPPRGLSVIDSSVILQDRMPTKALSATIIDLAVRHYIKLYEVDEKKLFKTKEYEAELLRNGDDLRTEEQAVLRLFFDDKAAVGSRLRISNLSEPLYTKVAKIGEAAVTRVVAGGYMVDNKKRQQNMMIWGVVLGILGVLSFNLPLIVAVIVMGIIGYHMPARTDVGVEQRDYLLGLQYYMKLAEAERLKVLQSPQGATAGSVDVGDKVKLVKLYERILPYAMLFGIEKEWVKQFAHLYTQPPDWYNGNWSTFSAVAFASSLNDLGTAAASSFAPPSSSSSSGFSGGGSSGGGGGGGGGGGW